MAKDRIDFDFSGLYIPPWPLSDYEIVYLPFPQDASNLKHPLANEYSFLSLPHEAFDKTGENLICFQEKRLLGNEKIGSRPLPAQVFTQSSLRPEAFAHISLADTSPKALCSLMNSTGLIIAPAYEAQKRFIDSRFHNVMAGEFSYSELHPLGIDDKTPDANLRDLMQAANDVYVQHYTNLGGSDVMNEPFDALCGGCLTQAVTLSEYARRIACRNKDANLGGIVSYYEVLLTVRALFGAMSDLIDFSIADGSIERYVELISGRPEKEEARTVNRFALELLSDSRIGVDQRAHEIANVASYTVREGFSFLQQCITATIGSQWGRVAHAVSPARDIHKGMAVKTPTALQAQQNFYEQNEPRYLIDRYCEGSLSAALAAQFLTTLANPAPWKQCDNPECKAYFKHYFTDKGTSNSKATSCSQKCSTRKRNRLYNMEASAIRTACKRYSSVQDAVKYIEQRLSSEMELVALPRARKRWETKCRKALNR